MNSTRACFVVAGTAAANSVLGVHPSGIQRRYAPSWSSKRAGDSLFRRTTSFLPSTPALRRPIANSTVDTGHCNGLHCNAPRASAADANPSPSSSTSDSTAPTSVSTAIWNAYVAGSNIFTNLFPLWTLFVAIAAIKKPALFLWLTTPYFTLSLGVLMLSMGITLTIEDFKRVLRRFGAVAIGFLGCYVLMPALAIALAAIFKLPPDLAAGVILIGAVNGGQASNLCTYIANGNVALSVMMTTTTTLGAMIFTPLISKVLIGAVVPVDAVGMVRSIVEVVLVPITAGMLLNKYCNRVVRAFLPFSPVVGVIATCLLVGSSVAQCAAPIMAAGWSLIIPIFLLHLMGGLAGYFMPAAAGYGEIVRRTTAIETAMKSSAFGFLLASLHFANYMVRVPSAVSVVIMALVGSSMSVIWRYIPVNATLKFDRSLAYRKGPFDKFLKPSAQSGTTKH